MYCYKCGKELVPGAKFCHHCGADQSHNSQYNKSIELDSNSSDTIENSKIGNEREEDVQMIQTSHEETDIPKPSNFSKPVDEKQHKSPSFKQIWKDFINEDENTYSVFGEINKKPNESTSTDRPKDLSNDTTKKKASKFSKFSLKKDVKRTENQNQSLENKESIPPSLDQQIDQKSDVTREEKIIQPTASKNESLESKSNGATQETIPFSPLQEEKDNPKKDKVKSSPFSLFKKDMKNKEEDKTARKLAEQSTEKESDIFDDTSIISNSPEVEDVNLDEKKGILAFLQNARYSNGANKMYAKYVETRKKALDESPITIFIFIIGFIFSSIPIFFITRQFDISSVVLSILKALTTFLTFFLAVSIASSKARIRRTGNESLFETLFLWTMFQVLLTFLFFIFPENWSMGRNILGALTPHLIATLIQYVLLIFIINALYLRKENEQKNIDFLGWFLIIFITVDLMFKLFWVILNFLTGSIL